MQCSAVQRSVLQCSVMQCGAVQCDSTVQCSAVQYSAVRCGLVQFSSLQCSTVCGVQCDGAVQCSAVWSAAVQCGAVQCGAVKCGAVWCGAVAQWYQEVKVQEQVASPQLGTVQCSAGGEPGAGHRPARCLGHTGGRREGGGRGVVQCSAVQCRWGSGAPWCGAGGGCSVAAWTKGQR